MENKSNFREGEQFKKHQQKGKRKTNAATILLNIFVRIIDLYVVAIDFSTVSDTILAGGQTWLNV